MTRLWVEAGMELIHYGSEKFEPERFRPIADNHFMKPLGGFWGCPIHAERSWPQWCLDEDFHTENLKRSFRFRFEGRLLIIDGLKDLRKIPWVTPRRYWCFPLFQPLLLLGVDAIWLTERGQYLTRHTHPRNLYGWDCESVLVMNPETILA